MISIFNGDYGTNDDLLKQPQITGYDPAVGPSVGCVTIFQIVGSKIQAGTLSAAQIGSITAAQIRSINASYCLICQRSLTSDADHDESCPLYVDPFVIAVRGAVERSAVES